MGNDTAADNATLTTTPTTTTTLSPEEQAKADEMLKLQQKITQEIQNSNLKETEMNELQVRRGFLLKFHESATNGCLHKFPRRKSTKKFSTRSSLVPMLLQLTTQRLWDAKKAVASERLPSKREP